MANHKLRVFRASLISIIFLLENGASVLGFVQAEASGDFLGQAGWLVPKPQARTPPSNPA
jgi:hypothetical protein